MHIIDIHPKKVVSVPSAVEGGPDLAEQALLLLDMLPPDGRKAPEELGLLVAQVGWYLDADLDQQIASARPAEPGNTLALQAHDPAGLGAGRDGHGGRPVEGLDVDPGAERGLGHGDNERREQVIAAPVEPVVGGDADDHVEVADPAAAPAGLALAEDARQLDAVVHAGGHGDRDLVDPLHPPVAVALMARRCDLLARAVALRARVGGHHVAEDAAAHLAHGSRALAAGAPLGGRPRLAHRAGTRDAGGEV